MKKLAPFIAMAVIILTGCSSHTYDDIEPQDIAEDPMLVVYTDVKVIIDNVCLSCHSNPPQNGAPMSLSTYMDVKNAVETRGLLDRISRDEGAGGLMPLGGPRLPQNNIDLIVQWNEDGLLEN